MRCAYCSSEAYKRIELKDGFTTPICKDCEKLRDLWLSDIKK